MWLAKILDLPARANDKDVRMHRTLSVSVDRAYLPVHNVEEGWQGLPALFKVCEFLESINHSFDHGE